MMNNVLLGTWRMLSMRLSNPFTLSNSNGQEQQSVAASHLSTTHPIRYRPVNSLWSLSIILIGLLGASSVFAVDLDTLTEIQTLVNEFNNKDNSNDITDSALGLPLWLLKVAKDAEAARVNP
jgi:hypothetical protein